MNTDLQRVKESKQAYRTKLAQKPIAEKLEILNQLAERTLAIRRSVSKPLPASVDRECKPTGEVGE